jgi:hypothetical protein
MAKGLAPNASRGRSVTRGPLRLLRAVQGLPFMPTGYERLPFDRASDGTRPPKVGRAARRRLPHPGSGPGRAIPALPLELATSRSGRPGLGFGLGKEGLR